MRDMVLKYQGIRLRKILDWYQIKIAFAGICGSRFKDGTHHYQLIMEHEFSGMIDDSPGNTKYVIGTKVAVYSLLPCWECDARKVDLIHLYAHYDYFGSRRYGGFAQYVYEPENNIILIPEGVSLEKASLAEPVDVAYHAIYSAPITERSQGVIGGGPAGLLAAQWCRIHGCCKVAVADISKNKLDFAAKLGFAHLSADGLIDTQNDAFDVCVEPCEFSVTQNATVYYCRRKWHIILIGNPADTLEIEPKIYSSILRNEFSMNCFWNLLPETNWQEVLRYTGKKLILKKLITTLYPLSQTDAAFDNILNGGTIPLPNATKLSGIKSLAVSNLKAIVGAINSFHRIFDPIINYFGRRYNKLFDTDKRRLSGNRDLCYRDCFTTHFCRHDSKEYGGFSTYKAIHTVVAGCHQSFYRFFQLHQLYWDTG